MDVELFTVLSDRDRELKSGYKRQFSRIWSYEVGVQER
jgi:hypothetical protein